MGTPPWPANAAPAVIGVAGEDTDELTWTVPGGTLVALESVYAEIDPGSFDVAPMLVIRDQSGVVIARKSQTDTLTALLSGSATWALRLADDPLTTADILPATRAAWARKNTAQSITSGVSTNTIFDSVEYQYGTWISLTLDATLLTVPDDGFYVVQAQTRWSTAAAGGTRRTLSILLNGSVEASTEFANIAGVPTDQNAVLSRFLTAGDALKLRVQQSSGGALNLGVTDLTATRVGTVVT